MKTTDKFLIGIVAGVILLVGVAFAVLFLRPKPTYQSDDTPEGVTHNYLLALKQKDLARAYGYLSPTLAGYPASPEAFTEDVENHRGYYWYFGPGDDSVTLEIESVRTIGDDRAVVSVRERHYYRSGLFGSNEYANTFDMTLRRWNDRWQIVASDLYWASCWGYEQGCQ